MCVCVCVCVCVCGGPEKAAPSKGQTYFSRWHMYSLVSLLSHLGLRDPPLILTRPTFTFVGATCENMCSEERMDAQHLGQACGPVLDPRGVLRLRLRLRRGVQRHTARSVAGRGGGDRAAPCREMGKPPNQRFSSWGFRRSHKRAPGFSPTATRLLRRKTQVHRNLAKHKVGGLVFLLSVGPFWGGLQFRGEALLAKSPSKRRVPCYAQVPAGGLRVPGQRADAAQGSQGLHGELRAHGQHRGPAPGANSSERSADLASWFRGWVGGLASWQVASLC